MAVGEEAQGQKMNWTKNYNGATIGGSGGGLCRPSTRLGEKNEYENTTQLNTSSSVVLDEINRINNRICCLEEALTKLSSRISPVLCSSRPTTNEKQPAETKANSAPMHDCLIKLRTSLEHAVERAQDLIDRCVL